MKGVKRVTTADLIWKLVEKLISKEQNESTNSQREETKDEE